MYNKFLLLICFLNVSANTNLGEILKDLGQLRTIYSENLPYKQRAEDLIRQEGYVCETHEVKTEDGYWLTIHRIPRGLGKNPEINKPVVILHHGLFISSAAFVISGPENGLAFALADEGYDVWMPNARGNLYSKRHEFLDPAQDSQRFWNFSFHEMGYYDLPASIDYILDSTGQQQVHYIGFSMGTTISYVLSTTRPEYNDKIKVIFSLAPVAYLSKVASPIIRYLDLYHLEITDFFEKWEIHEIFTQSLPMQLLNKYICQNEWYTPICEVSIELLAGFDMDEFDKKNQPKFFQHFPAGASWKTLDHYLQNMQDDKFRPYDYGWGPNVRQYGHLKPKDYDLSKITPPVILFQAKNDWIVSKDATDRLLNALPHVVGKIVIKDKKFSHFDFVFAKDVKYLVIDPLVDILNRYRDNKTIDNECFNKYNDSD